MPWRLDGDYQTKVTVTNVGTTPAFFTARLKHTGGDYILGARELAPGATAVFDLRALRDEQRRDQQGHVIPLTATSGQFYWSLRDGRPGAKFAGRSEIVSVSQHVSSSYSCALCCTDSYGGGFISPNPITVGIDGTQAVSAWENMSSCYGGQYSEQAPGAQWSVENSSIVSVDGSGVHGVADGETTLSATWDSVEAQDEDIMGGGCIVASVPGDAEAAAQSVRENVAYPGPPGLYSWPYPMVATSNNPTSPAGLAGTLGQAQDNQYPPASFSSPLAETDFTATQRYFYCTCEDQTLHGLSGNPHSITRYVRERDIWFYGISKDSDGNEIELYSLSRTLKSLLTRPQPGKSPR